MTNYFKDVRKPVLINLLVTVIWIFFLRVYIPNFYITSTICFLVFHPLISVIVYIYKRRWKDVFLILGVGLYPFVIYLVLRLLHGMYVFY